MHTYNKHCINMIGFVILIFTFILVVFVENKTSCGLKSNRYNAVCQRSIFILRKTEYG